MFQTDLGRVYLPGDRIEELLALVRSFKVGQYVSALLFLRPIQWYLKRWNHTTHELRHKILLNRDLNQALHW